MSAKLVHASHAALLLMCSWWALCLLQGVHGLMAVLELVATGRALGRRSGVHTTAPWILLSFVLCLNTVTFAFQDSMLSGCCYSAVSIIQFALAHASAGCPQEWAHAHACAPRMPPESLL